jgi:hypothetical protein
MLFKVIHLLVDTANEWLLLGLRSSKQPARDAIRTCHPNMRDMVVQAWGQLTHKKGPWHVPGPLFCMATGSLL